MALDLFKHNKDAYVSVLSMLAEHGKAAVVHPTGTGKSFIGFKLCEDFPDKVVCWLSPSEYIFRTQIENLKAVSGGWQPENIVFFTYAKLIMMSEEDISEIKPDYIILDEFHRCGAEQWGKGVERLISLYPNAQILGLSATAIRYLDNQRDMADELFDGNIASEMTLGEAIVRGILNPPKYVMSVFAYQKDYDRLKTRVRNAKNKAVRDEAERYLEALRRALDMADGLDVIFDKHMTDRAGKYIVFCSNLEHMTEMRGKAYEWFAKIDNSPHIYTAYSDDPTASKAFNEFKKDNSDHLKLLFCIDMLNEGVHVDDVSGVILFRPTVSPIIYKQQIGRALSANKNCVPVIFDIVNNIENLYSIGTIQQEMQVAVNYYRYLGESEYIVNEHFKVIDEVRDAKALFEQLNDTLTASWDTMYGYAEQYYAEHGNLEIPRRYKTADGYSLGNWIFTQRSVYAGEQYGSLDENRVKKLESIGMIWDSIRDLSWKRVYAEAEIYKNTYGNLKVPAKYVTDDGVRLGQWIANLRVYRKSGIKAAFMSKERIEQLDKLGMIWEVNDYLWDDNYAECARYYRAHGDLNLKINDVTTDGIRIGLWLSNQRKRRKEGKRGHEVTVVTGEPNYPEGNIYNGYENHAHSDENINGVQIHRCPIVPRKTGIFYRLLNYFSYAQKAGKYVKQLMASDGKTFDIVFVNQLSPILMAKPAVLYKKRYGVPVVMYCLDLWPESLVAGGVSRGSLIYKWFHHISKQIYRSVDCVLITSRMFRGYLKEQFGVEDKSIKYLPQYAEGLFEKLPFKESTEEVELVFAGNIGAAQSMETIIRSAEKLKGRPVHFHIIGSGTDLGRVQKLAKDLKNVTFYGRRPLEEMPEFYAKADAMLVTLQVDSVLSLTLPGKVQSYMAVGKPIIGSVDGETAEVIKEAKCGYCGKAGDVDELVKNIEQFIKCSDKKQMGLNARLFYETNFERQRFMDNLEKELEKNLNVDKSGEYSR